MPIRNPLSLLPRRLQIVAVLTLVVVACIIFGSVTTNNDLHPYIGKVPYGTELDQGVHQVVEGAQKVVDRLPNPLAPPAHAPPPAQADSSSGDTSWFSHWTWRHPFSNSVTFDQERAVLPPLRTRPYVYTYYDLGQRRKDEKSRTAEQDLLKIWRRAWWAAGFKPVVLSKSDATKNPLYAQMQHVEERALENELMRWLAWDNMGTGILSNFLTLPMAAYDHPFLSFLRRGVYPKLTRYDGLGNGMFIGSKHHIRKAIKVCSLVNSSEHRDTNGLGLTVDQAAMSSPALKRVKYIDEALPEGTIDLDSKPDSIAFYSENIIKTKYKAIGEKFNNLTTVGEGLSMLPTLINSHLHLTWQTQFPKGVAVLKPLPEHTTAVIEAALNIATNLTECAWSPIPGSCPPNTSKCKPCVSNLLKITTPKTYRNESDFFTISTMPHPYTMQSLLTGADSMNVSFIRRETKRDVWIKAVTKGLLVTDLSNYARLSPLKDVIASEQGSIRSLWFTAEQPFSKDQDKDLEELDWIFGFRLPRQPLSSGKSETPVPGPERRPKPEYGDRLKPTEAELQEEHNLLQKAKGFIRDSAKQPTAQVRSAIEAWNLADTEAWKFMQAFNTRRTMERKKWEKQEASYLGKSAFGRWKDKIA